MSWEVSVNRYKYSQEKRRKLLKKMAKQGIIIFRGLWNKNFVYIIPTHEAMEEYKRRIS